MADPRVVLPLVVLLALAGLPLASAQGPERTEARVAAVRLLHLHPERGPLNVWIGGTHGFAAVEPGAPSAYVAVPAGTREIVLAETDAAPANETPEAEAVPASVEPLGEVELPDGGYATLLLLPAERVPEAEGDGATAPLLLPDAPTGLPAAGRAGLRLVHADSDAGRLALVVRDADRSTATTPAFTSSDDDASGHLARVEPLAASAYAPVPAGRHALWLVREEGGAATAAPIEAVLRRGTLYTLYAIPGDGEGSRAVLAVDATAPVPLHRSPP